MTPSTVGNVTKPNNRGSTKVTAGSNIGFTVVATPISSRLVTGPTLESIVAGFRYLFEKISSSNEESHFSKDRDKNF